MKLHVFLIATLAAAGGWFAAKQSCEMHHAAGGARRVLYYQSPMHPWVKSDKPGECTVCGMDLVPIYEDGKNFDGEATGVVMLPAGSPNIIGVQTVEVKKRPLVRTLRVSGMIGEDESRHGIISAPVEGRIDGLAMNHPGQQITRRQPLATIFSRTLLATANEYKAALPAGEAAAEPAKRRLEQYGLVWEQIKTIPQRQPDDFHFGILAQVTGTVVKSYVSEGQYVKEGDRLFEIADFTKMWFHFAASEQDLPWLKAGLLVKLSTPSLPGESFTARVGFINPNIDEMSRASMVRVVLENPERHLKNQSFAEGHVELEAPEVLAVPRGSVLWSSESPRVYVELQSGVYEQHKVKLGRVGDGDFEVLEGLQAGQRIVTSGNMLIDGQAQINRMASPEKP